MMIKRTEKAEKKRQGPGIYKNNMEEEEVQGEARLTHRGKRSIANCTKNTSEGVRVTWTALLVLHLACMFSNGLEIPPVHLVNNGTQVTTHYYNYCLGEPLRFHEPIDAEQASQEKTLSWYFDHKQDPLFTWFQNMGSSHPTVTIDNPTKYQQYQKWGLEVMNVTKEDEGVYIAEETPARVRQITYWHISMFNVSVISPPKLSSWMLELTREVVNNETVKLTCGEVKDVGDPPFTLELKAADGTVLNTSNTEGNLTFIMPKADDTGDFVCEINWDISQPAASCVERKAWRVMGPSYPCRSPISTTKPAPEAPPPTTTDSSMMTSVLVGLVAAGVGALVGAAIKSMMKKKAPVQAAVTSKLEHVEVAPVEPEAPRDPLDVPEEHESIYSTSV